MSRRKVKPKLLGLIVSFLFFMFLGAMVIQLGTQSSQASQGLQSARVTNIVDGDTIDIASSGCRLPWRGNSQLCRIRLSCIDTPERGQQPFFNDAKNRIEQLLPLGTEIMVRDTGDSSYGRIVAEIFLGNQSINLRMVREGKAVVFCRYLNNCASSRNAYLSAEAAAKKDGVGVWNPRQPWTQARESQPCSG
ncbi:MAG TPA: nuclease [Cyanobacteria bacterium UBA11368]|nr:nuclease [Cyanobacteria bacterium UBA11368]